MSTSTHASIARPTRALAACSNSEPTETSMPPTPTTTAATSGPTAGARTVEAAGTTFRVDVRGDGPPLLVVHGAGEDASMLAPLADALAATGRRVITYDRRGTGASGRHDWPGAGADQHADDAAALLRGLAVDRAEVLGLSSGGIIAVDLAVRHPDAVGHVVAWEPPALGVVDGGDAINEAFVEPIEAHLRANPGDFVGAQAILLSAIIQAPVAVDDPRFAATRVNAEPMVRDDTRIPSHAFSRDELAGLDATIAVGTAPNGAVGPGVAALAALIGTTPLVVDTPLHEIYLVEPALLADLYRVGR
jgi:pimeloyl-ACP methyl ester carboxylesterase